MTPGSKEIPVVKATWSRPKVRMISVKKDTFGGTLPPKEGPNSPLSLPSQIQPQP